MASVMITGGSGKLGQACISELLAAGWDVVNLDRRPAREPLCPFMDVNLLDYDQVVRALSGVDAVVHLAAIAVFGQEGRPATFAHNVSATYNVFSALREVGVKRVVWASSETVLGVPYELDPLYLPIDEEYPPRPADAYSFGKLIEEDLARHLCRMVPDLKMAGLRFSNVMSDSDYKEFIRSEEDVFAHKRNLWGYLDSRDAGRAVRLALEGMGTGLEVMLLASADTLSRTSNIDLVKTVFPKVPLRGDLGVHRTLLPIAPAERLIGFVPEHSWRELL